MRRVGRQGLFQSVIASLQHLHLFLSFQHLLAQEFGSFTNGTLATQQEVIPVARLNGHDSVQSLKLVFAFLDGALLFRYGLLVVIDILYCLEDRV